MRGRCDRYARCNGRRGWCGWLGLCRWGGLRRVIPATGEPRRAFRSVPGRFLLTAGQRCARAERRAAIPAMDGVRPGPPLGVSFASRDITSRQQGPHDQDDQDSGAQPSGRHEPGEHRFHGGQAAVEFFEAFTVRRFRFSSLSTAGLSVRARARAIIKRDVTEQRSRRSRRRPRRYGTTLRRPTHRGTARTARRRPLRARRRRAFRRPGRSSARGPPRVCRTGARCGS